jgi:hypothetical protein
MCLLLILLSHNSRFGEFNSRLTGANSRFVMLREFAGKTLICFTVFATKRRFMGGKSTKLPICREKPGIFPGEPAVALVDLQTF